MKYELNNDLTLRFEPEQAETMRPSVHGDHTATMADSQPWRCSPPRRPGAGLHASPSASSSRSPAPAGRFGQAAAKSVELAFNELNEAARRRRASPAAGSPSTCATRSPRARSRWTRPRAARRPAPVPAIIGGIISSVSIPIVTTRHRPGRRGADLAGLLLADADAHWRAEGQTHGWFFRTITSRRAAGHGGGEVRAWTRAATLAIIHVNNDFGVNMVNRVPPRLCRARRADHRRRRPTTRARRATRRGDAGAARRPAGALPRLLSRRRHQHRAHLDPAGRRRRRFLLNDGMNSAGLHPRRRPAASSTTPSARPPAP